MVTEGLWDDGVNKRLSPSDRAFYMVLRDEPVEKLYQILSTRRKNAGFHGQLDEGLALEYVRVYTMLEDKFGLTVSEIEQGIRDAKPFTDQEERDFFEQQIQMLNTFNRS